MWWALLSARFTRESLGPPYAGEPGPQAACWAGTAVADSGSTRPTRWAPSLRIGMHRHMACAWFEFSQGQARSVVWGKGAGGSGLGPSAPTFASLGSAGPTWTGPERPPPLLLTHTHTHTCTHTCTHVRVHEHGHTRRPCYPMSVAPFQAPSAHACTCILIHTRIFIDTRMFMHTRTWLVPHVSGPLPCSLKTRTSPASTPPGHPPTPPEHPPYLSAQPPACVPVPPERPPNPPFCSPGTCRPET